MLYLTCILQDANCIAGIFNDSTYNVNTSHGTKETFSNEFRMGLRHASEYEINPLQGCHNSL
jgi:hypothetical protein